MLAARLVKAVKTSLTVVADALAYAAVTEEDNCAHRKIIPHFRSAPRRIRLGTLLGTLQYRWIELEYSRNLTFLHIRQCRRRIWWQVLAASP